MEGALIVMGFPPILGRLHPLVLHFPIVLVPAALVLELLVWRGRIPRRVLAPVLVLAACSAALTAGSGWILSHEDGYGGARLERHENLGIALAVLTALAAVVHGRAAQGRRLALFRVLLGAGCAVLGPGAHLGATLTHGVDWLQGPAPVLRRPEPVPLDSPGMDPPRVETGTEPVDDPRPLIEPAPAAADPMSSTYAEVIAPILASRCTSCHGEAKKKGGLRLHDPDAILRGGHDGPVIVAGDPAGSLLLTRVRLPLEDEEHMPPEGKPQPSAEQLALLAAWIASGAPFEGVVDLAHPPVEQSGAPQASPAPTGVEDEPEEALQVPGTGAIEVRPGSDSAPMTVAELPVTGATEAAVPATGPTVAAVLPTGPSPAFLDALREAFVHVEFLQQDPPRLWIDAAAAAGSLDDGRLAGLLEPGLAFVAELSLARTAAGPRTLKALQQAPHLVRLDLRASAVRAADLEALRGHAALEELVLAQTDSASTEDVLLSMPALQRVFLWRSGIEGQALDRLVAERPQWMVSTGVPIPRAPLEDASPVASGTTGAPVNSRCPVSGNAVDPTHVREHEGRLVGFCCPDCPQLFLADPGAFPVEVP